MNVTFCGILFFIIMLYLLFYLSVLLQGSYPKLYTAEKAQNKVDFIASQLELTDEQLKDCEYLFNKKTMNSLMYVLLVPATEQEQVDAITGWFADVDNCYFDKTLDRKGQRYWKTRVKEVFYPYLSDKGKAALDKYLYINDGPSEPFVPTTGPYAGKLFYPTKEKPSPY